MALKTIRISFDVVFVAIAAILLSLIVVSILDINKTSDTIEGRASIYPNTEPIVLDGSINSTIDGVKLKLEAQSIEVKYKMSFTKQHSTVIVYHIINIIALNINLFFILFILFHIRNIINSILKEMKSKQIITHYIFSKKNIKRARYIAFGFILFPIIEFSTYLSDKLLLIKYLSIKGMDALPTTSLSMISWDYIFIGLIFIAIVEIIHKGIAIQEENDLTV